jgi:hypothetical protein
MILLYRCCSSDTCLASTCIFSNCMSMESPDWLDKQGLWSGIGKASGFWHVIAGL